MNDNSVLGKNWILKRYNEDQVNFLKENFDLSEIVSKLIAIRNINIEEVKLFLNPKIKNFLPNPFILKDMEKAADRTVKAIKNNEKIGIFGDYDVDGATSTAILGNYFDQIDRKTEIYIPDRKSEGYGPNKQAIDKIKNKKNTLLIMVDCGTNSHEIISYTIKKGIDVVKY